MNSIPARYHLGYELEGERPVISVHTDPAHLDEIANNQNMLSDLQEYLGIDAPFTFDPESFGYSGVGRTQESGHVLGWTALKFALPSLQSVEKYRVQTTPQLLPVVSSLSVTLNHLNQLKEVKSGDPANPQLIIASLSNTVPLNEYHSAPISAYLTSDALERLTTLQNLEDAEEQVRQGLKDGFEYPYRPVQDWEFRVTLENNISFNYPGDGSGFFADRRQQTESTGLSLSAANNDYPLQQVAILGGLAALNNVLLGR